MDSDKYLGRSCWRVFCLNVDTYEFSCHSAKVSLLELFVLGFYGDRHWCWGLLNKIRWTNKSKTARERNEHKRKVAQCHWKQVTNLCQFLAYLA